MAFLFQPSFYICDYCGKKEKFFNSDFKKLYIGKDFLPEEANKAMDSAKDLCGQCAVRIKALLARELKPKSFITRILDVLDASDY